MTVHYTHADFDNNKYSRESDNNLLSRHYLIRTAVYGITGRPWLKSIISHYYIEMLLLDNLAHIDHRIVHTSK